MTNNKTSKDIIVKLIDNRVINGEEAYTLIRDLYPGTYYSTYPSITSGYSSIDYKVKPEFTISTLDTVKTD